MYVMSFLVVICMICFCAVLLMSVMCFVGAGRTQEELDAFSALYKQQYSVEYGCQLRAEMDQQEEHRTQLLKQRV